MSEYRAPRGANPWRTAETALRETARTAFDEGHDSWGSRMLSGADCIAALDALAAEVRELRAKLDSEASHRLSLCADNERFVAENAELRKARERAKPEIEKAVELIQRWGCECEPQIGFTCGPCRVVEIIDAAMGGERKDGE